MFLSIIIPAYNEEKRLPKTLLDIDKYLRGQDYDYEIIVVSDGSTDKTADVVKSLIGKVKNLKLIDNKVNHGKGFVARQGLLEAEGEIRLFTDADNSTSIDQVEKIFPWIKKGFDIVIGSRDIEGAVLDPPQPFYRQFLGKAFRLFFHIVCGLWMVKDSQCGFKAFSGKAAEDILPRCRINRFAFDPEILAIGERLGYKIKEIPVRWRNDIHSKVKLSSTIKMALDLLKIRWNLITNKYGIKK
ncbi:MAG TPA: glycosyltransferase family 2 protein [Candidatus Parcubacteria bacterium]|nr:glycosyltransferase family 2 protein [Candidatus Parcubacteria bacterium]